MFKYSDKEFFKFTTSLPSGFRRARRSSVKEHIVMTPTKKGHGHTTIRMERMKQVDKNSVMHIAGGDHKGIIINKEAASAANDMTSPQLSLEFKVFLKNASSSMHTQESRLLKFWFKDEVSENDQMHSAQDFFKELISPCEFPRVSNPHEIHAADFNIFMPNEKTGFVGFVKIIGLLSPLSYTEGGISGSYSVSCKSQELLHFHDLMRLAAVHGKTLNYVGFIKKIMKLMQGSYSNIKMIEVEMKQLENMTEPPARPTLRNGILLDVCAAPTKKLPSDLLSGSCAEALGPLVTDDHEVSMDDSLLGNKMELTKEKLLEVIESSYPTPISINEMADSFQATESEIEQTLQDLLSKNLIKSMSNDTYTRVIQNDTEVKMVKQMPTVISSQQPTIAIITAQYCEKLAVDAMIENTDTYVRYKTEGESNVYTLGNIGAHRVVSTKLPTVGHSRSATIAAGSTTTRLLGIFQRVEYVFLVGVGGGVTHYTDYSKHVRQGDIVISAPSSGQARSFIYMFFERMKGSPVVRTGGSTNDHDKFNTRTWCPPELVLQTISQQLWNQTVSNPELCPWKSYIESGVESLKGQEADFSRPSAETDKLYMSIGEKDLIEVGHPSPPEATICPRNSGMPVVHFGGVGSGRMLMRDDSSRMEYAHHHGVKCFVTEFDSVVESIFGNRKDNYIFIRGISDYKDGTMKKEWQPCAALAAAAFMKAVICALDPCDDE